MGRKKRGKKIDGILLLDKSSGFSSNSSLQKVKRIFHAQKAGHTGSLDPLASGMLPVCFGEATKISAFLLDADKRYEVTARLGCRTTTADAEGEIIEEKTVPEFTESQIEAVLANFKGEIQQIPPMYSALKHKGQRLYDLARQGVEVEREPRNVRIFALDLLEKRENELDLEVYCSKGTYIRTLVEDIGEQLGCGAHVSHLRRTGVGVFNSQDMHTMEEIESAAEKGEEALLELLLPIDSALANWPEIELSDDIAFYLRKGQPVIVPHAPTDGWVRLKERDAARFIGVGEILDDGRVAPRRMLNLAEQAPS